LHKAQSAMEYLMTYGWAILIIAVVLAILYQLGLFGGGASLVSTSCLATTGFLCASPQLNTTGNLIVQFGQVGETITLTGIACTNSTTTPSAMQNIQQTPLATGQKTNLVFTCALSSNTIGTTFKGYLWVQYNSQTQNGNIGKVGAITAVVSTAKAVSATTSTTSTSSTTTSTTTTIIASFVQATNAFTSSNSATCTFGSNVQAGDVLVAMYNVYGSATGTPSIGDTQSLSWSRPLSDSYVAGAFRNTILYATAASTGAEAVTATGGGTTFDSMLICYEISGASTSGVLTSGGSGNGGAPANSIVPLITPSAGSFVAGSASWNNNPSVIITPDSGYTLNPSSPQSAYGSIAEYYSNWGGGSTGVGFTFNALNTGWYEAAIALQHS